MADISGKISIEKITGSISCKDITGIVSVSFKRFCDEYQVVYDFFIKKPSGLIAATQNAMVKTIANAGYWGSKLDFFHLEGGHTDDNDESKINWILPGTYDMYVSAGSPGFLTNYGFKGDGSIDLMKNHYILDGTGKYKQDDACIGVYIMENISESGGDEIGVNAAIDAYIRARYPINSATARLNDTTNLTNANITDARGLFMVSRPAAATKLIYKNGIFLFKTTTPSTGLPGAECSFLGTGSIKSTKRQGCVFGGAGVDEKGAKVIADAVNTYFTTVESNAWEEGDDFILIADKESQFDKTDSDDVDYSTLLRYPKYIIGLGDYSHADRSIADEMYLYKGYSGVNKIFACFGNHELNHDATGAEWKSFFNVNRTYYLKKLRDVEFFFYDTLLKFDGSGWDTMGDAQNRSIAEEQASTQGKWLINALNTSSATWKVLVYHIPTWASNYNLNMSPQMAWDWCDYGVDLILNAHMHFYERLLIDTGSGNVPVVNCGTSGANQLTIGDPITGSIIRINDDIDADFASGMFITMSATSTTLSINLHSVDNLRNVIADKDTLVLNK